MIGRTINDRFRIVSLIARGGMGKVYRAEQSPRPWLKIARIGVSNGQQSLRLHAIERSLAAVHGGRRIVPWGRERRSCPTP